MSNKALYMIIIYKNNTNNKNNKNNCNNNNNTAVQSEKGVSS